MTNTPPPDDKSSQTTALGFDEFIAILVAFATIGAILFWSFSRRDSSWNLNVVPSPSPTLLPSTQPNPASSPAPTVEPALDSNSNALPSPPTEPVVEPPNPPSVVEQVTPTVIIPSTKTEPTDSPQVLVPVVPSANNAIPQPFSLVTPSEKKSTIPPPIAFTDVPSDFWGRRFINVLSSRNIIKGFPDYSFRPNQPVSRAEFAAIVQQAFDKKLNKSAIVFKDVKEKSWATPAINHAISTGFLTGYPNKIFQPDQKILRVQVLVALVTGLNLKPPTSSTQVLSIYKDAKDIPNTPMKK